MSKIIKTIEEAKIKKVLFNEISLMLAGIGVVSSMMFWVMNPQQEMQLELVKLQGQIESNESVKVALQGFRDNDINELQLTMQRIENRQIDQIAAIAKLEALIK